MDALSSVIEYEDHVYVPFRIDHVGETPYLVFYLEPSKSNHKLQFVQKNERLHQGYRGALNLNDRSYLFMKSPKSKVSFYRQTRNCGGKSLSMNFCIREKLRGIPFIQSVWICLKRTLPWVY